MVEILENTVGLFPGNGVQKVGMGEGFYHDAATLDLLLADARTVEQQKLIYEVVVLSAEGPEEKLNQAQWTQSAIVLHAIASAKTRDALPAYLSGHSLGWIAAAAAAGVITTGEATQQAYERGSIMDLSMPTGGDYAMLVVMGPIDAMTVEEVCRETGYHVANDNRVLLPEEMKEMVAKNARRPNLNQFTVVGPAQYLATTADLMQHRGGSVVADTTVKTAARQLKAITLPFHSPYMNPAAVHFKNEIRSGITKGDYRFEDPQMPLVATIYDKSKGIHLITTGDEARQQIIDQVPNRIRWAEAMRFLTTSGVDTFVGYGNAKLLDGMVQGMQRKGHDFYLVDEPGPAKQISQKAA